MKKKILIVASSLTTGGLEKSIINLCDNFDYDKYEVDLYLFNEGRALLHKLNSNVNLLPDSPYYAKVYNLSLGQSLKTLVKEKKFGLALYRIGRWIRARLHSKKFTKNDWKRMKKTMLKIDKHYDVAIGYEEGSACYYVADCISADKKIGWIHTDIKKINNNKKLDKKAFEKLDYVVTVSQNSLNNLAEVYPLFKDKYRCISIGKLVNEKELEVLSKKPNSMDKNAIKILSIGRLVELKGFHLCVPVLKMLKDDGFNVKWYVAGEGDYRSYIETEIEKHGLKGEFILLGNCDNPYSLINSADICVQPSSYEGFGMAVFEEKFLKKPVVATNIPSNCEMLTDGVNGLIIERNSEDIYTAVKHLLDDSGKREQMAKEPVNGLMDNKQVMREIEDCFR